MSFDTLTIECFLAVNDTKSFTLAANKVMRTQSAVSQQINKLENKIGKRLFNREKNLTLTLEGEIFLNYAKQIMQLNREALDRFKEPELQGEIRFGLPEDFASVFLSDLLAEYALLHPRILLNVECDLTLNLFDRFKNREFDIVLVKMNKPEDFPNGIEVYSENLEWVGHRNFFARNNIPILKLAIDRKVQENLDAQNQSILNIREDLSTRLMRQFASEIEFQQRFNDQPIPLVISPKPCVYRTRAISSLDMTNIKWRIAFSSHSYAGKIAALNAGMGITVLPRNMIPKDTEIIQHYLPKLDDSHISLLKHDSENVAVNNIERFILKTICYGNRFAA